MALGVAELREAAGHALDTHLAGNERRDREAALGDVEERRRELVRLVAEDELQAQLLG